MSSIRLHARPEPATSGASAIRPVPWSEAGLTLLAHGSSRRDDDVILRQAARIRRRNLFADVTVGFVKNNPDLQSAVAAQRTERSYIVPCFMADGYFTRRLIPETLRLSGPITVTAEGRVLNYCAPVGASPLLGEIVRRRVTSACRTIGKSPADTTILLIAHGSPSAPGSFDAIRVTENRLGRSGGFADVRTAFLEEAPTVEDMLSHLAGRNIVAMGILASEGVHGANDVPGLIDASGTDAHYAGVIGAGPGALSLVLERIRAFDRDVLGAMRPSTPSLEIYPAAETAT
jgi:sirohydrochlorin cobaltochelatase